MRLIILDINGGEKFRTNIVDLIFTSDGKFQVEDENDIISDATDTFDEAVTSLVSKLPIDNS
jgi:hypothetical protein